MGAMKEAKIRKACGQMYLHDNDMAFQPAGRWHEQIVGGCDATVNIEILIKTSSRSIRLRDDQTNDILIVGDCVHLEDFIVP